MEPTPSHRSVLSSLPYSSLLFAGRSLLEMIFHWLSVLLDHVPHGGRDHHLSHPLLSPQNPAQSLAYSGSRRLLKDQVKVKVLVLSITAELLFAYNSIYCDEDLVSPLRYRLIHIFFLNEASFFANQFIS